MVCMPRSELHYPYTFIITLFQTVEKQRKKLAQDLTKQQEDKVALAEMEEKLMVRTHIMW